MKAETKIILRLFRKHIARFVTLIAISIVSIGFMYGIMEIQNKIEMAIEDTYQSQNISDLYIKSKRQTGFNQKELELLKDRYGTEHLLESFCYEEENNGEITRFYYMNLNENKINKFVLEQGRLPAKENEILVERKTNTLHGYALNETINYRNTSYVVVGTIFNPLINNKEEEPSFTDSEKHLSNVLYFHVDNLPIINDVYITLENRDLFHSFSSSYKEEIENQKSYLLDQISSQDIEVLSLYENYGLYSLNSYAEKVSLIGIIFVVFFFIVTLLVVDSTMTRLLDEERTQIACQKTLGYSSFKIIFKYILFVGLATLCGGIFSLLMGFGLTYVVYNAFYLQYVLPEMSLSLNVFMYLFLFLGMMIGNILLILFSSLKLARQNAIQLLTPKSPKKGKKVLLERVKFLWNRLSFKYKSTLRNIFLFKSRFFMTVLSVIGATVLVFAGFGLLDCTQNIENGNSLVTVSIALIAFSALLCALVIYNITNINVSERNREIATLMVLGYKNNEVTGYIFREIYIMSAIGAILGLPLGILFLQFVFYLIDFGSLSEIHWWTYLIAPIVTMLFSFLSTFFLYRKIVKTDMNASLKILE